MLAQEDDMKALALSVTLLVSIPSLASAGEVYGTIKEGGKPVKDGLKVELACGAKPVAGETDKFGAYRLFVPEEGKCTLTLRIGDESPSVTVHSFADSARYNLALERKEGKVHAEDGVTWTSLKRTGGTRRQIVLHPVGGLLAALAVAGLGFFGSQFLAKRQAEETRARFYSEMINKREESDSALRKDMFMSIIQSFLGPGSTSIDDRTVKLELLAYNFHESLNLKPLFTQLETEISKSTSPEKREQRDRIEKVAMEVTRKEMVVLEGVGKSVERTVDFDDLAASPGGLALEPARLALNGIDRNFSIVVKTVDVERKEMQVRLEVRTARGQSGDFDTDEAEFWTGFFDFPMIDHTRLSRDQRCRGRREELRANERARRPRRLSGVLRELEGEAVHPGDDPRPARRQGTRRRRASVADSAPGNRAAAQWRPSFPASLGGDGRPARICPSFSRLGGLARW